MVIGKSFVWAHLPKTGGNSTLRMFQTIKAEIVHFDDETHRKKHHSFKDRAMESGMDLGGKTRFLNIRRLPSYLLSFSKFQQSVYSIPPSAEMFQGMVHEGRLGKSLTEVDSYSEKHLDDVLRYYEYDQIAHWLRTEYLAEDFMRYFGEYGELGLWNKLRIRHTRTNVNRNYNRSVSDNFSRDDIATLYASCPIWAEVERQVYGDLMIDRL